MSTLQRILLGLLLIVSGIFLILAVWKFGSILGIFLVYPWAISKISGIIINPHLAKIVGILLTAFICLGLNRLYKYKKLYAYLAIVGLMIANSLIMFFVEKDRFYEQITGQPLKYYTINPIDKQYQLFDKPVFDAFGQKAQVIDFVTAQKIYRQKNQKKIPLQEISGNSIVNFFDPLSGEPLVYYSDNDNKISFFLYPGFDPITGKKLEPINIEIVNRYRAQTRQTNSQNQIQLQQQENESNKKKYDWKKGIEENRKQLQEISASSKKKMKDEEIAMIIFGIFIAASIVLVLIVAIVANFAQNFISHQAAQPPKQIIISSSSSSSNSSSTIFQQILNDRNLRSQDKYKLLTALVKKHPDKIHDYEKTLNNNNNLHSKDKACLLHLMITGSEIQRNYQQECDEEFLEQRFKRLYTPHQ